MPPQMGSYGARDMIPASRTRRSMVRLVHVRSKFMFRCMSFLHGAWDHFSVDRRVSLLRLGSSHICTSDVTGPDYHGL